MRYVEAVNGAFELRRKDSVGSGLSTQNSDGPVSVGDAFDGFLETNSSAVVPIEGEVVPGPFLHHWVSGSPSMLWHRRGSLCASGGTWGESQWRASGQLPLFYPVGWQWHQGPVPVVARSWCGWRTVICVRRLFLTPFRYSDPQAGWGGAMATSEPLFHSVQSDEALRSWLRNVEWCLNRCCRRW
ncbi:hypothetical protein QJS10_CPA02g01209 [Acorus calamus]|uniref:PH domain-containing protein n=1 Tax=Acorus calamus TaxID=4465 RepID=A0AAV9FDA4_ACOCL|nr:hypothetical protein QJS10_CPA02g01209 [Acorus calamus]